MSKHIVPYRSGITQFYWWMQYAVCWPFIRVGRGVRRAVAATARLGRRAHQGALWLAERWAALLLTPAEDTSRTAMAVRWVLLLAGFALVGWGVLALI